MGLGLMVIVTTLFLVDVFAERRAVVYTDALGGGPSPDGRDARPR